MRGRGEVSPAGRRLRAPLRDPVAQPGPLPAEAEEQPSPGAVRRGAVRERQGPVTGAWVPPLPARASGPPRFRQAAGAAAAAAVSRGGSPQPGCRSARGGGSGSGSGRLSAREPPGRAARLPLPCACRGLSRCPQRPSCGGEQGARARRCRVPPRPLRPRRAAGGRRSPRPARRTAGRRGAEGGEVGSACGLGARRGASGVGRGWRPWGCAGGARAAERGFQP